MQKTVLMVESILLAAMVVLVLWQRNERTIKRWWKEWRAVISPPLSEEDIQERLAQAAPIPGTWCENRYLVETTCEGKPYQDSAGMLSDLALLEGGQVLQLDRYFPQGMLTERYYQAGADTFSYFNPVPGKLDDTYSITIVSPAQ